MIGKFVMNSGGYTSDSESRFATSLPFSLANHHSTIAPCLSNPDHAKYRILCF